MELSKTKWPTVPLGSLATFRNGVNFTKDNFGKGIKIVGVSDFKDFTSPRYELLDEINPKGIVKNEDFLQKKDILFVRSNGNRQLIGRSLFIDKEGEPITHSAFTIRTRFHDDSAFSRFYAYVFRTPLIRHKLTAIGGGTNISNLNQQILSSLEVPHPEISIQKKISAILSNYDELINNNLRHIQILEEMAQSLYREWFVNFRFPGYEKVQMVNSPMGRIPNGWDVLVLENLISHHIGGGWGKEEEESNYTEPAWVIRGTDIPKTRHCQIGSVPYRYHTQSNLASRTLQPSDVVFEVSGGSKDQLLGRTLFISEELLRAFSGDVVICASFCKKIRPNPEIYRSELLYLSFLHGYESGEISQYQVQSTGISNFKWTNYIQQTKRIIPPNPLQNKFGKIIEPIFNQIGVFGLKIRNLRQSRDLLLPKLISGELDISELDIKIPEEAA